MRNKIHASVLLGLTLLVFSAQRAHPQDARSFALGGCGSGLEWGPAALLWIPSTLQNTAPTKGWLTTLSASAFDATNSGSPALEFDLESADASLTDPIRRAHDYQGFFGAQVRNMAGGFHYQQTYAYRVAQSTLDFLHARGEGPLAAGASFPLDSLSREERIQTLAVGYGQGIPLGQMSGSGGGTLKLHQGSRFRQGVMTGVFTQGTTGGATVEEWSAKSGSGFSWDTGFFFKPSTNIRVGYLIGNVNSSFKWKAQKSTLTLDPLTGLPNSTQTSSTELEANRPRFSRLGLTLCNQDGSSTVTGEYVREDGDSHWRFGLERVLPGKNLVVRAGTFQDKTSSKRIWTVGLGIFGKTFEGDLAIAAREFPVIQDSAGFGLGFSFSNLF